MTSQRRIKPLKWPYRICWSQKRLTRQCIHRQSCQPRLIHCPSDLCRCCTSPSRRPRWRRPLRGFIVAAGSHLDTRESLQHLSHPSRIAPVRSIALPQSLHPRPHRPALPTLLPLKFQSPVRLPTAERLHTSANNPTRSTFDSCPPSRTARRNQSRNDMLATLDLSPT